jgi:hypothetical protein
MSQELIIIISVVITFVVSIVLGFLIGNTYRKKVGEAEIGSAEQQAEKILEEAGKTAETLKKEALIEAKEKIIKEKSEAESEIKERRVELSRLERRAVTREETLDRKIDNCEKKEEALNKKIKEHEDLCGQVEEIKRQQILISEADLVDFHMRIAFADIGDFVSFGYREIPLITDEGQIYDADGKEQKIYINEVNFKNSDQVDTQLIKEVKKGKDGVGIKLLDRCKSLEWLDKYFTIHPADKQKQEYEIKKLEAELKEREARTKLIEKQAEGENLNTDIVITMDSNTTEWGG